jgi:arginine:agmatine antiporter
MTKSQSEDVGPRKLGPVLATLFVTGNMVGSGLFLLPATLGAIGGISVFTWVLATIGALLVAVLYARLGVLAPWAGGPYAYARATLGRYFGFQTNYIYWISSWVGNVGIALAVTGYAAELLPALKAPILSATVTSGIIWLMVLANIIGPRIVGGIEAIALCVGLAPALIIGIAGWAWFDPTLFMESWNVSGKPAIEVIPASMVLVFWAFTGLESAAVAVDVIDNPRRNLPIAALLGVAIAAAVYMACCTVLMGIVPARELAESSAPFALVATRMFGPAVAAAIVLTTMLKAMGTHGGWTLVCAATSKAAADGSFPRLFARTDRRGIPARGLLVHGALMTGATFATMSPSIGQQFNKLIDVSVVLTLVCYCYSAIALCRMRRWRDSGAKRDWLIAIAAFAFSAWVIVASDLSLLIIAVIIIATSGMFYPFFKGGKNMRAAA